MDRNRLTRHLATAAAAVFLSGALACAPLPPPGVVLIERAPPGNRVEVITVAPGPGWVWIGGFWRWERNDFFWMPGRWRGIERGYRAWVPGSWVHSRRGWYWRDGHWR